MDELITFLREQLRNELDSQGHRDTGTLIDSIKVTESTVNNLITIKGESILYGKFVDAGRKKGARLVPISVLTEWVKRKGIENDTKKARQIAFAIATTIKKEGIPTSGSLRLNSNRLNFVGNVLKTNEAKIKELITKIMLFDADVNITNIIRNTNAKLN